MPERKANQQRWQSFLMSGTVCLRLAYSKLITVDWLDPEGAPAGWVDGVLVEAGP